MPRMAYLLSRYPAVSHTFFLHEVLGLRSLGVEIETASINQPDRPVAALPNAEAAEATTTWYVKGGSTFGAAVRVLRIALVQPAVVLRGLRAVRQMDGLTRRKQAMWLAYLAEALLVGDWMRRKHLGHLHVHFGGPVASVGMLTSIAWGVPYSLTIHGPEELLDVNAFHLREKLMQARFVVCISDFARSQLMHRLPPSEWGKLHVVRLGVTDELLQAHGDRAVNDVLHVVCVGRLVPEKGQRLLLQAARELLGEGIALRVTLVGNGPELASLNEFVQRHGLQQAVTMTGALSHAETQSVLQTADIFALPSFAEGVPVALMEAMAFEIPCVSTTIAGIGELIRSGVDGLLVPASNVDALTDALRTLCMDAVLRRRMGASARAQVTMHYRLAQNHLQLAALFRANVATQVSAA